MSNDIKDLIGECRQVNEMSIGINGMDGGNIRKVVFKKPISITGLDFEEDNMPLICGWYEKRCIYKDNKYEDTWCTTIEILSALESYGSKLEYKCFDDEESAKSYLKMKSLVVMVDKEESEESEDEMED